MTVVDMEFSKAPAPGDMAAQLAERWQGAGRVLRTTRVYLNPSTDCLRGLRGIVIRGDGDWDDFEISVFYIAASLSDGSSFGAGRVLGSAQSVATCYPGQQMKNHIHVEVRQNGRIINPARRLTW